MLNRAYFFKNIRNINELKKRTRLSVEKHKKPQRYTIIRHIIMAHEDFLIFCKSFIRTQEFIIDITHKLIMNEKYEFVCIAITSKEADFVILVNSSGYSYARIIAMIKKGK